VRGADVLRLECGRERRDGVAVRALQQRALALLELEQATQVVCVEQQLLVARSARNRAQRALVCAAREALDSREQLERAERLVQERVRARVPLPQLPPLLLHP